MFMESAIQLVKHCLFIHFVDGSRNGNRAIVFFANNKHSYIQLNTNLSLEPKKCESKVNTRTRRRKKVLSLHGLHDLDGLQFAVRIVSILGWPNFVRLQIFKLMFSSIYLTNVFSLPSTKHHLFSWSFRALPFTGQECSYGKYTKTNECELDQQKVVNFTQQSESTLAASG